MKKNFTKGLLFASMIVASSASYSHGGPYVYDQAVFNELSRFHNSFKNEFMNGVYKSNTKEVKVLLNKIIEGIRLSAMAITETAKENSKAQINNAVQVQHNSDQVEAEFQYEVGDPCSISATSNIYDVYQTVAAVSGAVGRGGSGPGSGGTGPISAPTSGGDGGRAQMARVNDIATGAKKAPATEVIAAAAASGACATFADKGLRSAACIDAGFKSGAISGFTNADISAKTLMDGPQKVGGADKERKYFTVKTSADPEKPTPEDLALAAYMRNLGVPFDLRSLEPGELRTAAGRRYMAIKDTFDARMSMSQRPMARHVSMITQNSTSKEMKDAINDMIADDPTVSDRLTKSFPGWVKGQGISVDELMNADVERRYSSVNWLKKTVTESEKWIAGEQARIAAQQSLLLWRLNQESRETNVLLGAVLGSLTRAEMIAEMKSAHNAATR